MILVIGATGTTGRLVLDRLSDQRLPVRALVRPASNATAGRALASLAGVDVVIGDVTDHRSLSAAMGGVERVFLAMGNGPGQLERELAVVRAATQARVGHLVKVSAPVVGPDAPVAVARMHHEIEQAVRAAGLDHTFLRPYAFMQNLLNLAPTIRMAGFFSGITGDAPMNMVDARDIADVAVVTLTTHRGRGPLVLTGAEAVSYPEVARRLTALGRPTRYLDLTRSEYRRALQSARLAPWLVDHLEEIQTLTSVHPEHPTTTVADLTGRTPRGLDAFLVEQLGQFSRPHGWRERLGALPLRAAHRRSSSGSAPERRGRHDDRRPAGSRPAIRTSGR